MLLDAISSYAMCKSMLTKYHSAHGENRDRRMREVVPYKRLKTMENKAQKVVSVAYKRWSFTRGSNCNASTRKIVLFWIGGHLWKVDGYESWPHMAVRL